jgi:hypothetical protein
LGRGLGFGAGEEIDGGGGVGREQATCQRKKEVPDTRAWAVRERRGWLRTPSGKDPGGLWAASTAGPNGSPAAFSDFLFFFLLFLFYFIFSFISFAKFIQINSNLFLYSSNIPH